MYTPLTYSSDKLSIPSFADEDSQKLLEELLTEENE